MQNKLHGFNMMNVSAASRLDASDFWTIQGGCVGRARPEVRIRVSVSDLNSDAVYIFTYGLTPYYCV